MSTYGKYCPFLVETGGGLFTTYYDCRSSGQHFDDSAAIYCTYCKKPYEYAKCPYFKPAKEESGGCYLTSACVEALGKADDCEELTLLRAFRDDWLAAQPRGKEEIGHYYAVAPRIVAAIHALPDAGERLHALYQTLVQPCVAAIKAGDMEAAHRNYRAISLALEEQYIR